MQLVLVKLKEKAHKPTVFFKSSLKNNNKDLQAPHCMGIIIYSLTERNSAQSLPSAKSWNLVVRRKGEKEEQVSITDLVPIATQVA